MLDGLISVLWGYIKILFQWLAISAKLRALTFSFMFPKRQEFSLRYKKSLWEITGDR